MNKESNRRRFLKMGAGTVAGAAVLASSVSKAVATMCGLTPAQTPGPFYPGESSFSQDNDLTKIPGRNRVAKGQVILIQGQVIDLTCTPVSGATVEIWQACESGRYNNPTDTNTAVLDPDFKYWGEAITDQNGQYNFKTILPGAYPADVDWTRPPHIHFKVSRLGYKELVTQMYFKGNAYNDHDLILKAIPPSEQDSVIVDFLPVVSGPDAGAALIGTFNITIQSVK